MSTKKEKIFKCWSTLHHINDAICDELAELDKHKQAGRTQAQVMALRFVLRSMPGGISLKDLARKLGVTPGAASQMVESLVHLDWVERSIVSNDRRSICIKPTKHALEIHEHLHVLGAGIAAKYFSVLSPSELRSFEDMVERIMNAYLENKEQKKAEAEGGE